MPGSAVRIYECRVDDVSENDKTLDATSIRGRKFKGASWLLPYIDASGSGFDCTPKVGSHCIILGAENGLALVAGFRISMADGGDGRELANRIKDLRQGSQVMRAVGEDGSDARVVCYRGGTVLIGSGSLAVTLYTALGSIQHIFNSFTMAGPGGSVSWTREDGSDKVEYAAHYRVNVKEDDPGFRVDVKIKDGDVPVLVRVTREKDDPRPALELSVDKDGIAHWKGNILQVDALASFVVNAPNVIINGRRVRQIPDPL